MTSVASSFRLSAAADHVSGSGGPGGGGGGGGSGPPGHMPVSPGGGLPGLLPGGLSGFPGSNSSGLVSSGKPVPMKLFATWEVDRTPPNCIPR